MRGALKILALVVVLAVGSCAFAAFYVVTHCTDEGCR